MDAKRLPAITAALALAACGPDSAVSGEWAGTVEDSAGVTVVKNPSGGLWTSAAAWRLEEELRIGVAEGDPVRQFGSVEDIAVDGGGRIHVLDGQAREVRVFDVDGGFVRTIGGPGGGPGELDRPGAVLIGAGDTIYVPDAGNQRVQRFLADGSEAGSFPLGMSGGIPIGWGGGPEGLLLQEVRLLPSQGGEEGVLILIRAGDGEIRDTLVRLPIGQALAIRNGAPQMTLFAPEPMWTALEDGRIATGRTSEYRLEIRTGGGRVERIVRKAHERLPFGADDRRELRQRLREHFEDQPPSPAADRLLQSMEYADHYPVFASLFGGPGGSLWVRHALDVASLRPRDLEAFDVRAFGGSEYDVFDREGRLLGTIVMPEGFRPMRSRGEHVYGVLRDELGVEYVVRMGVGGGSVR